MYSRVSTVPKRFMIQIYTASGRTLDMTKFHRAVARHLVSRGT